MSIPLLEVHESPLQNIIAENVRVEAARRGLKQRDIAKVLGITTGGISQKWTGKRSWTVSDIEQIGYFIGVEPWELCKPQNKESAKAYKELRAVPDTVHRLGLEPRTP